MATETQQYNDEMNYENIYDFEDFASTQLGQQLNSDGTDKQQQSSRGQRQKNTFKPFSFEVSQRQRQQRLKPQKQSQQQFQQSQGVQGPFGRFVGEALNYQANPSASKQLPHSLQELFQNIPLEAMMIENWIRKRLVLTGDNQPLDKALQHLNRHKITSIPIINEQNGNIKGMLECLDIVNYLCAILDSEGFGTARWDFILKNTGQLLDESKKRTVVMSNQASMYEALKELAKGESRVMVVDSNCQTHVQNGEEQNILGIFSQADITRFLSCNPYWLKLFPNSKKSLRELNILDNANQQVLSVNQNSLTREAFKKMIDNNTSGICVVDDQGRLVANLSASNVRGLSRRNFQLLNKPIFEFLQRDRRRGWWTMPICLSEDETLDKCVLQFYSTGVHQMYICDAQGKPQYVVDLTDVIKQFVTEEGQSRNA